MRWLRRGVRAVGRWCGDHGPSAAATLIFVFVFGLVAFAIFSENRANQRKDRCREMGGLVVTTYGEGWACVDRDYRLIHVE